MTRFFKLVAGSVAIALLMVVANYFLGFVVSFFTGFGERQFLSTGSLVIFILTFSLHVSSHFEKKSQP